MPNKPKRLSPSALRRYQTCPRQFLWGDLERRPRSPEGSPQLAVGNAVHAALERFFGVPEADRTMEILHRALRSVWPAHREQAGFANREEEAEWGRHALGLLDSFGSTFGMSGTPLARERWVRAVLTGITINTKLDRIDPAPGGGVEVIDYKTGRCRITAADLAEDPAIWVTVLATTHTLKKRVAAIRYLFLADATEVVWTPAGTDVKAEIIKLDALVREITNPANTFEATPGDHCRFCPFAPACPDRERVRIEDLVVAPEVPF